MRGQQTPPRAPTALRYPLYEAACTRGGLAPWPPSQDTLNLFAGYLKVSNAFASLATYWWAMVEEARERRCGFRLDRD